MGETVSNRLKKKRERLARSRIRKIQSHPAVLQFLQNIHGPLLGPAEEGRSAWPTKSAIARASIAMDAAQDTGFWKLDVPALTPEQRRTYAMHERLHLDCFLQRHGLPPEKYAQILREIEAFEKGDS